MEPDRFEYSPIIDRPIITWPDNARVAFWLSPNVEYIEYDPVPNLRLFQVGRVSLPSPNMQRYRTRDYGNRVGFWRMLEVIDKYQIRC